MEITKQSLPRRIISLLLALAIMIGFVPVIDIDLTAFAADGGITLDDTKDQSGDNWVWDSTTHTLSLYNAYIWNTFSGVAFKYEGSDTLKINQIGYNLIGNGYIEANKIEVIGSGILDFDVSGAEMFETSDLTLSNGYITSSNAYILVGSVDNTNVTISNCVLDIPNTTIEYTNTFTINSGYVTASRLVANWDNFIGGYLKLTGSADAFKSTIFDFDNTTFGAAVVQGESMCFCKNDGSEYYTDYNAAEKFDLNNSIVLIKTTLVYGRDETTPTNQKEIIGGYYAYYSDSHDPTELPSDEEIPGKAYYLENETQVSNRRMVNNTTIVCAGKLTLDNVSINSSYSSGTFTSYATAYANELVYNSTNYRKIINGCVIGGNVTLDDAHISAYGRLYCTNQLTLNSDCTIQGDISSGSRNNAQTGAITVYSQNANAKTLNFNNNKLEVSGDFSVKASSNAAPFSETEKNIVVSGDYGQFAAAYSNSQNTQMITPNTLSTIAATAKANGRAAYTADNFGDLLKASTTNKPKSIYIGDEFAAQLIALTESANIICKEVYGDSADLTFTCSHDITDLDTVDVTVVAGGGGDYTDKFDIDIDYVDEDDKSKFKLTFSLKEDIVMQDYTVKVTTTDGLTATGKLTATKINVTLDFTKGEDEDLWWFFGDFEGANTECKATPDENGNSVWAWYPDGTEGYTGNVLVLNNLKIETIADNAIIVPAGTTIVVYGSQNKIQSKLTALISEGDVTIVGHSNIADESCLAMYSDNAGRYYGSQKCTYGAGLYAKNNGEVTIKNCWLRVDAGDVLGDSGTYSCNSTDENNCYGISGGSVEFINAKANITAGKAYYGSSTNPNSAAVYASDDITIKGNSKLTLKSHNYALQSKDGYICINDTLTTLNNAYKEDARTTAITTTYNYLEDPISTFYTKTANDSTTETVIETNADEVYVQIYIDGELTQTKWVDKYADFTRTFGSMIDMGEDGHHIIEIWYGSGTKLIDAKTEVVASGSKLSNTQKDADNRITETTFRIEDVESDYVVCAYFREIVPYVTVTNTDGNLGSFAGWDKTLEDWKSITSPSYCKYDEDVTLRFTAKDGYYIKTLTADGVDLIVNGKQNEDADLSGIEACLIGFKHIDGGLSISADVYYYSITHNSQITVECAELTKYNVTLTTPEHGEVSFSPSVDGGVAEGTTITATATPDSGYELGTVKVNGSTVTPNANGKFSFTVTKNTTVEVTFDKKQNSGGNTGGSTGGGSSHIINGTDQLPTLDGTGYNYKRMAEVLTTYKAGSTATIEVNGNYNIPDEVIKAIADGKLKVTIVMDSTTSRYVDGADIQTVKSVDAEVRRTYALDTDELSGDEALQLILFNFDVRSDLIVTLKEKNAGLFANLYKYTNGEFEFADCAIIAKDGKAVFEDYTTNGTYAIMLSEYSGLLGDMNNDGKLTAADATAVLRYVVGLEDERRNISVADFDGNGKINARDALMVLKRVVGLI